MQTLKVNLLSHTRDSIETQWRQTDLKKAQKGFEQLLSNSVSNTRHFLYVSTM